MNDRTNADDVRGRIVDADRLLCCAAAVVAASGAATTDVVAAAAAGVIVGIGTTANNDETNGGQWAIRDEASTDEYNGDDGASSKRSAAKKATTLLSLSNVREPSITAPEMSYLLARSLSLRSHDRLRHLNLWGSLRDDPDVIVPFVRSVLPAHPSLLVLELGGNRLGDAHAAAIGFALATNEALRELDLYCSAVGPDGARGLALGLARNSTLAELNLSLNSRIGPTGCRYLASALSSSPGSGRTGIRGASGDGTKDGGIRPDDVVVKMPSKKRAKRCANADPSPVSRCGLQVLRLSGCKIGDQGAEALAKRLYSNSTLRHLFLEMNAIGADSCIELAQSLRYNRSLCGLHLYGNRIQHEGAAALQESLRFQNYTLEDVVCWQNEGVTSHQQELIDAYCGANRRIKWRYDRLRQLLPVLPVQVFPHALASLSTKPDLLYQVLLSKPELCHHHHRARDDQRQQTND